jgi:hypothetical protein
MSLFHSKNSTLCGSRSHFMEGQSSKGRKALMKGAVTHISATKRLQLY